MAAMEDLGQCIECKVGSQLARLVGALTSDWGKGGPAVAKEEGNPELP